MIYRKVWISPKFGFVGKSKSLDFTQTAEGEFVKYKGRSYCWVNISENGVIQLNQKILDFLNLKIGMELLSIRSSDIAFTMGATGPLLERADNYEGEIEIY